jgi:hypothetical protein
MYSSTKSWPLALKLLEGAINIRLAIRGQKTGETLL